MRVYIAGPMTGLPDFNVHAFHGAAREWRRMGWDVLNPAEAFDGDTTRSYAEYVVHDLALLKTCDAIALLPGWDGVNARGSVWEWGVAQMLGLAIYDANAPVAVEFVTETKRPETILEEAQRLVHGDRGQAYGHPIDDYTRTGRIMGAILDGWLHQQPGFEFMPPVPDIDPRIGCLLMEGVKLSREVNRHKRDNLVDMAGYAECAAMVAERQAERDAA